MSNFLRYESATARVLDINTTTNKITRPNRPVYNGDIFASYVNVDGEQCLVVGSKDGDETITASLVVDGTVTVLTYTKATDTFALGNTALTNIKVDEFGKPIE